MRSNNRPERCRIDETGIAFPPGLDVLAGEERTNRTSLLQAVITALGSDEVPIKGDADEAYVELELIGETYTRELTREGATVRFDGDSYLAHAKFAYLFAFLLDCNVVR